MSHGNTLETVAQGPLGYLSPEPRWAWLAKISRGLGHLQRLAVILSMLAIVVACLILTSGVMMRYFFKTPTDWQDEACVFLIVGAVFLSAGAVQAQRGHIGIEAVAGFLSVKVNRARLWICDLLTLAFCSFFAWKSASLLMEAWTQGITTDSTWAPPLWIPYGLMTAGMMLLVLQLLIQVIAGLAPQGECQS